MGAVGIGLHVSKTAASFCLSPKGQESSCEEKFSCYFFFLILFDKAVFEVKVAVGRAVSPAETSFSHTDYIAMSVDQSLCIFLGFLELASAL